MGRGRQDGEDRRTDAGRERGDGGCSCGSRLQRRSIVGAFVNREAMRAAILLLGVAEVAAQGRLQVGGRPPKSVDLGVCSIR